MDDAEAVTHACWSRGGWEDIDVFGEMSCTCERQWWRKQSASRDMDVAAMTLVVMSLMMDVVEVNSLMLWW